MKTLAIVWQRLVKNGNTCPRCGDTLQEIKRAVGRLTKILAPRGIVPTLEVREINEEISRKILPHPIAFGLLVSP